MPVDAVMLGFHARKQKSVTSRRPRIRRKSRHSPCASVTSPVAYLSKSSARLETYLLPVGSHELSGRWQTQFASVARLTLSGQSIRRGQSPARLPRERLCSQTVQVRKGARDSSNGETRALTTASTQSNDLVWPFGESLPATSRCARSGTDTVDGSASSESATIQNDASQALGPTRNSSRIAVSRTGPAGAGIERRCRRCHRRVRPVR